MPVEVNDLVQRLAALKAIRQPWEPLWKDITNYVLPRRSFWDLDATEGQKPTVKTFDGAPLSALQLLVDGLQGYLVSPKIRWFRLKMQDERQQDLPGVADWLEALDDIIYGQFARSNFYEAIGEFFLDAASIGTAVMFVEDDVEKKRVNFSTRHMKECYIAEGRNGMVDVLYREFKMTNRVAYKIWGGKLTEQRIEQARTTPFGRATILHSCFPRDDFDPTKIDNGNMPWASIYVDQEHGKKIEEGGYEQFPYLVFRWRKNSDENYGRSPAADAIHDILRVNQIGKTMLEAGQKAVHPPLNVPASMRGMTKLIPSGENYFTNPNEIITPINLGMNYQVGIDQENSLKDQIRDTFRTRIFLLMEQLEKGPYTATEIRERQGEKAAVLGPTIGRLNSETLVPLIDRVYRICERNKMIPAPPASLLSGGTVLVEMQGPLAQSQKQYHEVQGVNASLAFVTQMAQVFPNSLDIVDEDELMRRGMDSSGAPQRTIRESPIVAFIRKKKAEAAAAQAKAAVDLEQQKTLAGNADQLNKPLQQGSMLEKVAAGAGR